MLDRWDSVAVITAIVVSVGIFRVPAEVARYLRSPALIFAAWSIGGLVSLIGALCYAELSSSFPEAGGNYVYLRESYGNGLAFLFGWTELLVIRTGSIAAVAFISAEYMCSLLAVGSDFVRPLAVGMVLALSFVNVLGLKFSKKIHNVLTLLTLSVLAGIIVFGVASGAGTFSNLRSPAISLDKGTLSLLGLALIPVLWTYGGWHENTFLAEETKTSGKTLPSALITAVLLITALYLGANFLYIYLIPVDQMAASPLIGSDVFSILFGDPGRRIFEGIVVAASLGSINAMIITGSRVTYAMAKDNVVFAYLQKVSDSYGTPYRAIILSGIWASVLILFGTFGRLLFFTGILVWFFFALVAAGIYVLRRKFPNIDRPYKVWGYPATPVVFVVVCTALFVNTLFFNPGASFAGLAILFSGVPVYVVSRSLMSERK